MLPPPTLSFTIPSVHDGLILQCRVYHPTCYAPKTISQVTTWRKRAAIVAHPYAPLGGCYDDPVVDRVASTILKEGFIVGTFNFRGVAGAQGRTSWQSKPEQNDYISFIGFMVYYLHQLQPPTLPIPLESSEYVDPSLELHNLSPIPSQTVPPPKAGTEYAIPTSSQESPQESTSPQPLLLLSGYSYGALITTSLPPIISSIVSPFQTPTQSSWHAEIRTRATFLADQQNEMMNERLSTLASVSRGDEDHGLTNPKVRSVSASGAIRMGGHENLRNSSHESHSPRPSLTLDSHVKRSRSIERVRSMAKSTHHRIRRHSGASSVTSPPIQNKGSDRLSSEVTTPANDREEGLLVGIPELGESLSVAYLLVSPLRGWINSLATMNLFGSRTEKGSRQVKDAGSALPECETKFTIDPTLALFGDDDVFVSVSKLRAWAERLHNACEQRGHPSFMWREVPGAGHFWHDHEAMQTLREEVRLFVSSL